LQSHFVISTVDLHDFLNRVFVHQFQLRELTVVAGGDRKTRTSQATDSVFEFSPSGPLEFVLVLLDLAWNHIAASVHVQAAHLLANSFDSLGDLALRGFGSQNHEPAAVGFVGDTNTFISAELEL
jgi:hypothetical protein